MAGAETFSQQRHLAEWGWRGILTIVYFRACPADFPQEGGTTVEKISAQCVHIVRDAAVPASCRMQYAGRARTGGRTSPCAPAFR